LNNRRIYYY